MSKTHQTFRYRCPYCNRAYKSAGGVTKHRRKGSRPGWCVAWGDDPAMVHSMMEWRREQNRATASGTPMGQTDSGTVPTVAR